jgi:hypothetical protein
MKKIITSFALAGTLAMSAFGADFTGYIVDKACSTNKAMLGNEDCAKRCLGRGDAAVLATDDGKVLAIANQDKVKAFPGKKVTVAGKLDGTTLTVDTVKEAAK